MCQDIEPITIKEFSDLLESYNFKLIRIIGHDRGLWKCGVDNDLLHLVTKCLGNSCNFLSVFQYDEDDPKDDFWYLLDNSILFSFKNKDDLNTCLRLLTQD